MLRTSLNCSQILSFVMADLSSLHQEVIVARIAELKKSLVKAGIDEDYIIDDHTRRDGIVLCKSGNRKDGFKVDRKVNTSN